MWHFLKKTEVLLDASKEDLFEVNPEKTKCVLMSVIRRQEEEHCIKIAKRSFEDVAKFEYLGTTLTDQNCTHEEIVSRLNSGNAYYLNLRGMK
jgi:uncharacterized protein YjaG (DUF416 family)